MNTNKTVTVVRVPKSDGVRPLPSPSSGALPARPCTDAAPSLPPSQASDLDLSTLARLQALQTRAYFYGGPALTQGLLSPFSIIVRLSDLRVVRVGEQAGSHAPSSALPIGATRLTRDTELVEVDLEGPRAASELVNRVLAVPMADEERDGQDRVVRGPVMGFVWVCVDRPPPPLSLFLSPRRSGPAG